MSRGLIVGASPTAEDLAPLAAAIGLEGFDQARDHDEACRRLAPRAHALVVHRGPPPEALIRACTGNCPILALEVAAGPSIPAHVLCDPTGAPRGLAPADILDALRHQLDQRRFNLRLLALQQTLALEQGPFTHRAIVAVEFLQKVLGLESLALYMRERTPSRILPRVASIPEKGVFPDDILVDDPELSRVWSYGRPGWVGAALVIPQGTIEQPMGAFYFKLRPGDEAAAAGGRLELAAGGVFHQLREIYLSELWERQSTSVEVGRDQMFQIEKLASLGQLSAGIAHEINNPLFVITGNLEMAIQLVEEPVKGLLTKGLTAAERIRRIVYDMRQFFLPTPRKELVQAIDLDELLDNAVKIVSLQPIFKNMEFVCESGAELPTVLGDDNQLLQVFTNLFLNAAQASPQGGPITVRTRREGTDLVVEVEDRGVGITPEDLPRIFDPFFTTKQDWSGTGLGLAVTHTIVKNHSGSISVQSKQGEGTCVMVRLPASERRRPATPGPAETGTGPIERHRGCQLLVVDDEENVRDYLEYLLVDFDYAVDTAADGDKAIELMVKNRYQVVVMDQIMPGMNGIETTARLKQIEPDCHVILLTGAIESKPEGLDRAGFFRVLMKPCKGEDVLSAVGQAFGDH